MAVVVKRSKRYKKAAEKAVTAPVAVDAATAVREYAAGKIEFRNDSGGNVHAVVGKLSFDNTKLVENINSLIGTVRKLKPQTSKGAYFKKIVIKATMTPAVQLAV